MKDLYAFAFIAACFSLLAATVIGWVMNIVYLIGYSDVMSTGTLAVRIVGIPLWPLGAAMGWFG